MMRRTHRRTSRLAACLLTAGLAGCNSGQPAPAGPSAGQSKKQAPVDPNTSTLESNGSALEEIKAASDPVAEPNVSLLDVTSASGLDFVHRYDSDGEMYIVEPIASGIATLDFDCDGLEDIFFLNGTSLPVAKPRDQPNQLYRNWGQFQFRSAAAASRTTRVEHSVGVCVGDYDNDGFPDIFVNNWGKNTLLHNLGDGTYEDVTFRAGLGTTEDCGAGAVFLDANGNGLLDLYIGNYVQKPIETNVKRTTDGFASFPGPLDFQPAVDAFFVNDGDGTFTDARNSSGVAAVQTTSMGILASDFDNDGDSDILIVNDVDRNVLFENDGSGTFEDIGILQGVAFSFDAKRNGNMGVDGGDHNNDGAIDYYTTTFSSDLPVLYENDGSGIFADITIGASAGTTLAPHANWGVGFLDVNNDGHQDIFIGNGHTDPNVSQWAHNTSWKLANTLLLNDGNGKYLDVSEHCGSGLLPVESSRGVAIEDFDNDGRLDVVVLNALAAPTLIANDTESSGNWMQIQLVGTSCNRSAAGSRVVVEAAQMQLKEVYCGRGYQSSFGRTLHFGLGNQQTVHSVSVYWPNGTISRLKDLQSNQRIVIVEQ